MKKFLFTFLVMLTISIANAQNVNIDPTFNVADTGYGDYYGIKYKQNGQSNGTVYATLVQPDGKIILGGQFEGYNSNNNVNSIVRLQANGTQDPTFIFGTGFKLGTSYNKAVIKAIARQPDGKLLVGGYFDNYNGVPVNNICRLNTDGGFDPSFNPGSGAGLSNSTASVNTIAIQADGKIIIGGSFDTYNSYTAGSIARIYTDGNFDATFNSGPGVTNSNGSVEEVTKILIQPDGKILIGRDYGFVRVSTSGSIDQTFKSNTPNLYYVKDFLLQADGKIIILFNTTTQVNNGSTTTNYNSILRLNASGTIDNTFNNGGTGFARSGNTYGFMTCINELSNGRILVGGSFSSYNGIARNSICLLKQDGSLVTDSLNMGATYTDFVLTTAVQSDGKIIVGGNFTNANGAGSNGIDRINGNSTTDAAFNAGTGAKGSINVFAIQPDNKILVGGTFTSYNGVVRQRLARVNADGTNDNTYNFGKSANGNINTITTLSDGSAIVAGDFTIFSDTANNRMVSLFSDGTLNAGFNKALGTGFNSTVYAVSHQFSDGKYIVGGNFTLLNGVGRNYLARVNTDGTNDATFNIGNGGFGAVRAIDIQATNKIIIGGDFTYFNGITVGRIQRLNADGTNDASFASGSGFNGIVRCITHQPDGKIVVGGDFTSYNGTTKNKICRLNIDGTIDNAFVPATINGNVATVSVLTDGRFLVGGPFNYVTNTSQYPNIYGQSIIRLTATGAYDNTYNIGKGANGPTTANTTFSTITQLFGMPDGKVLIAGDFTSFNGVGKNRLAKLAVGGTTLPLSFATFTAALQQTNTLLTWATANEINTDYFEIERSNNGNSYDNIGKVNNSTTNNYAFTDFGVTALKSNKIYYRLKQVDKDGKFSYSSVVSIALQNNGRTISVVNTASNTTLVISNNKKQEVVQVIVRDVAGKMLQNLQHTIAVGSSAITINASTAYTGLYTIQIIGEEWQETFKIIK